MESKFTEHFTTVEMMCPCGCGRIEMDDRFMARIEELRLAFNRPMTVTSGYRCPAHNAEVSHTGATGPHTTGKAMDILICGEEAYDLLLMALQMGFRGMGINQRGGYDQRFVHIDDLSYPAYPRPRIWSY